MFAKKYQYYIASKILSYSIVILFFWSILSTIESFARLSYSLSKLGVTYFEVWKLAILATPLGVFQIMPYVFFFGVYSAVNSLFYANELVSFRSLGLSTKGILSIFFKSGIIFIALTFFVSCLFPITFQYYIKQKNFYKSNSILSKLRENTVNNIIEGKVMLYFVKLNNDGSLVDATFTIIDNNQYKVIFAKIAKFGYNEDETMIIQCSDAIMYSIGQDISITEAENFELPFELITEINLSKSNKFDNIPKLTSNKSLIKMCFFTKQSCELSFMQEFHARIATMIILIVIATAISAILVQKNSSRVPSYKYDIFAYILMGFLTLLRIFILDTLVEKKIILYFYIGIFLIFLSTVLFIRKVDRN
jgi:lipopolysaccharide export LptBFGC system permease protein LptF